MRSAWLLGDKVLDHDFCDMLIDSFLDHALSTYMFSTAELFRLYKVCATDVPVRQFLIDVHVYAAVPEWYDDGGEVLSEEVYRNITAALTARKGMQSNMENAPWLVDPCRYHWHKKEGGTCYKDKAHWTENNK